MKRSVTSKPVFLASWTRSRHGSYRRWSLHAHCLFDSSSPPTDGAQSSLDWACMSLWYEKWWLNQLPFGSQLQSSRMLYHAEHMSGDHVSTWTASHDYTLLPTIMASISLQFKQHQSVSNAQARSSYVYSDQQSAKEPTVVRHATYPTVCASPRFREGTSYAWPCYHKKTLQFWSAPSGRGLSVYTQLLRLHLEQILASVFSATLHFSQS